MFFNGIFTGIFMSSVYKMIALEFISDNILTTAGGFGMLCNGASRLFWSSMLD